MFPCDSERVAMLVMQCHVKDRRPVTYQPFHGRMKAKPPTRHTGDTRLHKPAMFNLVHILTGMRRSVSFQLFQLITEYKKKVGICTCRRPP